MRTTAPLGLLSILALNCHGLSIKTRCSSKASCVHSQNGVPGRLEVQQACYGANCGVDYGNRQAAGEQGAVGQGAIGQGSWTQGTNGQGAVGQGSLAQGTGGPANQNNQRFPQSNQGGRVVVNDNCSSGSQCSQNIGAGGQVQSTQRCNGAQCEVNYQQPAGAGGLAAGAGPQGAGGSRPQGASGQGAGGQGSWTQGSWGNVGGTNSGTSGTDIVNCGSGIRSVFQNVQNIVEVTCNSGRKVRIIFIFIIIISFYYFRKSPSVQLGVTQRLVTECTSR